MSELHTKEPWKVSGTEHIVAGGNYVVALDCKPEDARRIVACVNACAGLSTQCLEETGGGVEHYIAVIKQRDELLAALEKIASKCNLDMHGDDGSLGGYAYGIWNTANSAIASVKDNTK